MLSNEFPWYYQISSTSEKFPFFSHTLVPRYNEESNNQQINSKFFPIFEDIFLSFCLKHNIRHEKILRASLNLTVSSTKYPFTDPHVDHNIPHYNMLMYLNDCTGGETVIFKEKTDWTVIEHPVEHLNDSLTIEKEIIPKKGKIAVFDGEHFHVHRFCNEPERRTVCVITFTMKK